MHTVVSRLKMLATNGDQEEDGSFSVLDTDKLRITLHVELGCINNKTTYYAPKQCQHFVTWRIRIIYKGMIVSYRHGFLSALGN